MNTTCAHNMITIKTHLANFLHNGFVERLEGSFEKTRCE